MISKNQQKYISSLEQKKNRKKDNVFVAEGFKIVDELLNAGYKPKMIVACEEWMSKHSTPITNSPTLITVTEEELRKTSFLQHPQHSAYHHILPKRAGRTQRECTRYVMLYC